jgi:hypothetical protein
MITDEKSIKEVRVNSTLLFIFHFMTYGGLERSLSIDIILR